MRWDTRGPEWHNPVSWLSKRLPARPHLRVDDTRTARAPRHADFHGLRPRRAETAHEPAAGVQRFYIRNVTRFLSTGRDQS